MRSFFTLLLALAVTLRTHAQAPTPVIDWKAPTTLPTYLLQQVHQQYGPRRAALDAALTSAAGTAAYRDSARARFRRVLGPLPTRTPLRARVVGTVPQVNFRIEKIIYESQPHHHVTANLYVPEGAGKKPAALLFCGHENTSKATPSYQQTARLFARNGFVVLVIDPVSQGERMQLTDASGKSLTRGGTTEHTLLNAQANLLGRTLPAEELWDNIRGLDYLLTRPEVDAARVGCLGNSGGATQTAYFIGYDERVKVAALCSYVAAGGGLVSAVAGGRRPGRARKRRARPARSHLALHCHRPGQYQLPRGAHAGRPAPRRWAGRPARCRSASPPARR